MSKTYKATGINLKAQPFGEADRLVTILTQEFGLIRAIAPGARKHKSSLGGRTGMFVVNELLIAKGRSLDKITQAETVKTYPGLSKNLGKLAASQYLAEIVLSQALSEQPQQELYELLNEHLSRLQAIPSTEAMSVFAHLAQAVFHLLALAGLTPQVQACCLTGRILTPDFTDPKPQVGFSVSAGGTICLKALENLRKEADLQRKRPQEAQAHQIELNTLPVEIGDKGKFASSSSSASGLKDYETILHYQEIPVISKRLNATELAMLQQLSQSAIAPINAAKNDSWLSVEQILRSYTQYHLGHPIRSAALIDSYFAANHDATV